LSLARGNDSSASCLRHLRANTAPSRHQPLLRPQSPPWTTTIPPICSKYSGASNQRFYLITLSHLSVCPLSPLQPGSFVSNAPERSRLLQAQRRLIPQSHTEFLIPKDVYFYYPLHSVTFCGLHKRLVVATLSRWSLGLVDSIATAPYEQRGYTRAATTFEYNYDSPPSDPFK